MRRGQTYRLKFMFHAHGGTLLVELRQGNTERDREKHALSLLLYTHTYTDKGAQWRPSHLHNDWHTVCGQTRHTGL